MKFLSNSKNVPVLLHSIKNKDKFNQVLHQFPSLKLRQKPTNYFGFNKIPQKCALFLINFTFLCFLFSSIMEKGKCKAADATVESELRRAVLTGYDKNSRPIQNHQNVTLVHFNVFLKSFDFDERHSIFTVHAETYMSWIDEHIRWNPANYQNLTKIYFAAHELWIPDLSKTPITRDMEFIISLNYFMLLLDYTGLNYIDMIRQMNLDKSEIDHFANTRILAYNTSWVIWVPPTKFQVACTSDLRNWPVDIQWCYIILGSWAHDGSMIDIAIAENQTHLDFNWWMKNREWKLIGAYITKHTHFLDCCPGVPFPDIFMEFQIQREGATHKAAIVLPGLAIAMGVLIAFWIQPGATERLILLLVCLVNNTNYLDDIYKMLPNNGNNVPLVLLFYRDSLFMVSFAILWTIILRYLAATKRSSPVPLPGFIQTFLSSLPAKLLCLDPRPTTGSNAAEPTEGDATVGDDTGKLVGGGNPYQQDWAWLAHLLDRVAFVLYFIIYLCFYLALL